MTPSVAASLADPGIRAALAQAWSDSRPGPTGGHEEGGFIVEDSDGDFAVLRWPSGYGEVIAIPPHRACLFQGMPIVASFHTHPNTGPDYMQAPSGTDIRFVRDDPDLKGESYLGEFAISEAIVYLVEPTGIAREITATARLFS